MPYRDVDALLARIARLESERGAVRIRSKRMARRRMWRIARWLPVLLLVPLLVGGIALVVCVPNACRCESRAGRARVDERTLSAVAEQWRADHGLRSCPTFDRLVLDGALSRHAKFEDPWGRRYELRCEKEDVIVSSAGADGHFGTSDDIQMPESWKQE